MSVPTTFAQSIQHDLVCFSHLRWDFVFQRPQHLMTRFAKRRRVFYVEEPVLDLPEGSRPSYEKRDRDGVTIVVPHLPSGLAPVEVNQMLKEQLDALFAEDNIVRPVLWYYTPMALKFSAHIELSAVVYDCMDELSAFLNAPPELTELERELFCRADMVFTGGQSLYESKQHQHQNVYLFPSSIDTAHFMRARQIAGDPEDQRNIPHPRIGFFGVIDERLDIMLLDQAAVARPDWHFVMIGPVVKIDPAMLPRYANIHYLDRKSYDELPEYIAQWDVAMLPFARNESTRFISPTKTPEYLASGKPVVSTSIRDVVRTYGHQGLAYIGNTPGDFIAAIEFALRIGSQPAYYQAWLNRVDAFLSQSSWEHTWSRMNELVQRAESGQPRQVLASVDAKTPTTMETPDRDATRLTAT